MEIPLVPPVFTRWDEVIKKNLSDDWSWGFIPVSLAQGKNTVSVRSTWTVH